MLIIKITFLIGDKFNKLFKYKFIEQNIIVISIKYICNNTLQKVAYENLVRRLNHPGLKFIIIF